MKFESLACVKRPKFEFFQWLDRLEIISSSAHGGEQNPENFGFVKCPTGACDGEWGPALDVQMMHQTSRK